MKELTFRLNYFEGPLDLLLHLIQKNKVDIYDIPISEILNQYMEFLSGQNMDMDIAGDFIAMASQLIYIKSCMLLPKQQEEDNDPRTELVERLLEYQQFKNITPVFRERSEIGLNLFYRQPQTQEKTGYQQKPEDLTKAAYGIMERIRRKMPPPAKVFTGIVGREPASVTEQISIILKRFIKKKRLLFSYMFTSAKNRSELVAVFLAVLELSKSKKVRICGEGGQAELLFCSESAKGTEKEDGYERS